MQNHIVTIGKNAIAVGEGHIYLSSDLPLTYDYVPWNVIGSVIDDANMHDVCLIDIGANVGDSLAHFRRFSSEKVICIEPSTQFFALLAENAAQFGHVELVNKIYAPLHLMGKLAFVSGNRTGVSSVAQKGIGPDLWKGECITCDDLFQAKEHNYIIKIDTDGFDCHILLDVTSYLGRLDRNVPVILFEGPSAQQTVDGEFEYWFLAFEELQRISYNLLFLTNRGEPYLYAGQSGEVARSALKALEIGYSRNTALCHYYDVLAVHESVTNDIVKLSARWGEAIFRRY